MSPLLFLLKIRKYHHLNKAILSLFDRKHVYGIAQLKFSPFPKKGIHKAFKSRPLVLKQANIYGKNIIIGYFSEYKMMFLQRNAVDDSLGT